MRVLVTGASGFIGSYTCEQLTKEGYQVTGLVRKKDKAPVTKGISIFEGDITDPVSMDLLFKTQKIDVVFHLAAYIDTSDNMPDKHFLNNVIGTLNILKSCTKYGTKQIIYTSTMNVYGNPMYLPVDEKHATNPNNFYGLSKLIGELICKFYAENMGCKVIVLRYSGIYGPRRKSGAVYNFVRAARENKTIRIDSDMEWDILSVYDVLRANTAALKILDNTSFETINVGYGKAIKIQELARKIISLCGSSSKVEGPKQKEKTTFFYDIAKAGRLLNFKPIDINDSLEQYTKEV